MALTPVEDVRESLLGPLRPLPATDVPLVTALGLTLAADVHTADPLPPFDSAACDGYAVRSADLDGATAATPVRLRLGSPAAVGRRSAAALSAGRASAIPAGAPLPPGADAVVGLADAEADGEAVVVAAPVGPGSAVRPAGEEAAGGTALLTAGQRLGPVQVGMVAAAGCATVPARRRPVVTVVLTGDEVVRVGRRPADLWQVYDALGSPLAALLGADGCLAHVTGPAADDLAALTRTLDAAAGSSDLVVSVGGTSAGRQDLVVEAARRVGEARTWRPALAPSGTLVAGMVAGVPLIGLPGSPVRALVAFDVFVRPAVDRLLGRPAARATVAAHLAEAFRGSDGVLRYVGARSVVEGDRRWVRPVAAAGGLAGLAGADTWMVVPPHVGELEAGVPVRARPMWPGAW